MVKVFSETGFLSNFTNDMVPSDEYAGCFFFFFLLSFFFFNLSKFAFLLSFIFFNIHKNQFGFYIQLKQLHIAKHRGNIN